MSLSIGIVMAFTIWYQQSQLEYYKIEASYCSNSLEQIQIPTNPYMEFSQ